MDSAISISLLISWRHEIAQKSKWFQIKFISVKHTIREHIQLIRSFHRKISSHYECRFQCSSFFICIEQRINAFEVRACIFAWILSIFILINITEGARLFFASILGPLVMQKKALQKTKTFHELNWLEFGMLLESYRCCCRHSFVSLYDRVLYAFRMRNVDF